MEYFVPSASILCMGITLMAGLIIPAAAFFIVRKIRGGKTAPFFIGCAVMFLFAFVLEQLVHTIVLYSPVGTSIQGNIWLYALYGGAMAGLFEETGRLTAFSTILKKYRGDDANALMYGAGHGGFEAFYILATGMMSNIVISVMLNHGMIGTLTADVPADVLLQMETTFAQLAGTAPWMFLVGIAERLSAVCAHLGMSVLVWFAVKNKKPALYLLSILCHAMLDIAAVIFNNYTNLFLTEVAVFLCAMAVALIAAKVWKNNAGSRCEEIEGKSE